MVYHGHIKDGRVVLDEPAILPEGAAVSVSVVEQASQDGPLASLLDLAGAAKGLPADASVNHDHYLYGTPKRELDPLR